MTLTLPFFREAPLPGVLQKTDPAQLLCRSPPHGQRRRASTGRSRARPSSGRCSVFRPFAPPQKAESQALSLIRRIFRSRAASAKSRQSTSPRRVIVLRRPCRLHNVCPRSSRHAADFRFRPWLRAGGRSGFRVPLLLPFQSFRSFRAPPRGKSRNSQSRGNKPRRAAFGQKKSPARGRAT